MKKIRLLLMLGLTLGMTKVAFATCTGGGDPCNPPRNISFTAHSATTLTESAENNATPNPTNSAYFLEATTLGSPQDTATADANTVIVQTADFINPALATDMISAQVKPLLASTNYHGYSKVCPAGAGSPTDAGCSAWIAGTSQTTDALTNAGFRNIASADTAPQQFTARTNAGTLIDQSDVAAWLLTALNSTEVGNCVLTNVFQPFPASGDQLQTITSADCNTLFPNRPYTLVEHLVYTPTQAAPNYTTTVFYTQAADPVALTPVLNITHCSATLGFQNTASAPANPSDTPYKVTIGGTISGGSATQSPNIGGPVFSSSSSVTFTNLVPGTHYTPTVQAQNRGGGSWLPSNSITYAGGFDTSGTAGTFGSANITTTSADFTFSGLDLTGVTAYQMIVDGANFGAQVNAAPVSPINLSGLSSNTQHSVRIQLIEASCNFTVPANPGVQFYTLPAAPTAGSFGALTPTTIVVNWTDGSTNATPGTTYHLQYSSDGGTTWTDFGSNPAKVAGAAQSTTITGLVQSTTYDVRVKTISASGNSANDSVYFQIPGTATTPPDNSTITIFPNPATVAAGGVQVFGASVTDFAGTLIPNATVQWSLPGGGGALSGGNPAKQITFTAGGTLGPFTIQATKPGYPNATANITVVAAGVTFSQSPTAQVFVTSVTLSALASSFGGNPISYTWSVMSGPGGNVTFNPNGTIGSATSVATIPTAGNYTIQCTATDTVTLQTATQSVMFTVSQVLSSIAVSPNSATITFVNSQTFMAAGKDQFGSAFTLGSVSWSSTGGTISGAGVFQSGSLGTNITVTASSVNSLGMTIHGTASVSVVNYDVSTSFAYPTPYKSTSGAGGVCFTGLGSDSHIRIYTVTGRKVFEIEVANSPAPTTPPHCDYTWNVKNSAGESVASGVYLYVIESPTTKKNGKLIIIQ